MEEMGSLDYLSLNELRVWRKIFEGIIQDAKEAKDSRIYEKDAPPKIQLRMVVAEINKRMGLPEPVDQVIGLDVLEMRSELIFK